ncbi:MAG: HNH endonuclease [Anaerolineales bacterium]|nr:HNH endonuclease [Anaerolineales bacterium]
MNPHYTETAQRAQHRCEYCRAPESVFNFPFEVEHIQPLSLGGKDNSANQALACRSCNVYKGLHLQGVDPVTGKTVPLFHPRKDNWYTHFQFHEETGEIVGLTEIGRVTIIYLRANSRAQVIARKEWLRLGLYP